MYGTPVVCAVCCAPFTRQLATPSPDPGLAHAEPDTKMESLVNNEVSALIFLIHLTQQGGNTG